MMLVAMVTQLLVLASIIVGYRAVCPHLEAGLTTLDTTGLTKSSNVYITSDTLLDDDLDVAFIDVSSTAKLVFNRGKTITVKTLGILLVDSASLVIGSDVCRHTDDVNIILQGERDPSISTGEGQKYIVVKDQASLQIHGPEKVHFTKLSATADRFNVAPANVFYHHQTSFYGDKQLLRQGLTLYIFDGTTLARKSYKAFDMWRDGNMYQENARIGQFNGKLDGVVAGDIVAISVQDFLKVGANTNIDAAFDKIESVAGMTAGSLLLRTAESNDAFAMVFVKGTSSIDQTVKAQIGTLETRAEAYIDHAGYKITSICHIVVDNVDKSYIDLRILLPALGYPTISVVDDISSWNVGDEIFLASTDFGANHTERRTIIAKPTTHSLQLDRALNYRHFGEIEERVDMRGEVALLSHNIKISGELSRGCPTGNENCVDLPFDSYGGHIKIISSFGSVFMQGAELIHMGQGTALGFYPIHFHMCLNVTGKDAILKRNSIHNTFSRAITVHGTYGTDEDHPGVRVIENVAYDILGHAYFLEDGIEIATLFDGNIGARVKNFEHGFGTDRKHASVFWITNPKVIMINNVAAGADGVGIWYVFPKEPVGLSTGLIYAKNEAKRTPMWRCDNNVVHSCTTGLYADRVLENSIGNLKGYISRMSLSDPLDTSSEPEKSQFTRITAYKNWEANLKLRGAQLELIQVSSAESSQGIRIFRGSKQEYYVTKSVVMGVSQGNHEDADYPDAILIPKYQGLLMTAGPMYVSHTAFYGFQGTSEYVAGAISFARSVNFFVDSAVTSVSDMRFAFADTTGGNRMIGPLYEMWIPGDTTATFRDSDGSVTKCPGASGWSGPVQIVEPEAYLVTDQCTRRDNWNMAVCTDLYGKVQVDVRKVYNAATEDDLHNTTIRRRRFDDTSVKEYKTHANQTAHDQEYMLVLQDDSSREFYYEIEFMLNTAAPKMLRLEGRGIEDGLGAVVGICLPSGVGIADLTLDGQTSEGVAFDNGDMSSVASLAALNAATDMDNYYLDGRMLYFKLQSTVARDTNWDAYDTDDCPGGDCPYIDIQYDSSFTNTPCYNPTYDELHPTATITELGLTEITCEYPAAATVREADWGAGEYMASQDGAWGEYSSWSDCCIGETTSRYRVCDNPTPYGSGADCPGPATDTVACTTVCR